MRPRRIIALSIAFATSSILASAQTAHSLTEIESKYNQIEAAMTAENKAWRKKLDSCKSKAEKEKLYKAYPDAAKYHPQLTALMKSNPKDPGSAKAAIWVLTGSETPEQAHDSIEILKKYHINSKALDDSIAILWFTRKPEVKGLLNDYILKRKDSAQVTKAKYSLARILMQEKSTDEAIKLFQAVEQEGQNLYEFKNSSRTLADTATAYIYEAKFLQIGKKAPDIVGTDVIGKKLKLSDFAGKVIMLDFFGFW